MTNEQQEVEIRTDLRAGDDGGGVLGSGNFAPGGGMAGSGNAVPGGGALGSGS